MLATRRQFTKAGLLTVATLALGGCAASSQPGADADAPAERRSSFFAFDTVCVVGGVMSQHVLDGAVSQCIRFEGLLSRTIDTSDVARINRAQGRPVQVARETADLLARALGYCEESGGLFDITIGAVSGLWDFKRGVVPPDGQIQDALAHVDYRALAVDGQAVVLDDPSAQLDLGGIAKGYIADCVLDAIAEAGVESAFVNFGGNVKVLGAKADGSPWKLGVRDPQGERETDVVATVESTGASLVTSGLYERAFEANGRSYWHILDPRTGYPVESDLVSASIYSPESIDGEGYTKPMFMAGADEVLAWAESKPDLQVLLVTSDGTMLASRDSSFRW